MTDKQPEALRLADELDCRGMNRPSWKDQFDAGYELRRLHKENEAIRARLSQPEPAECDGGQCGIGGYCKDCPKTKPELKIINMERFVGSGKPLVPVCWMNVNDIDKTDWKVWAHGKPTISMPLFASPPQREWQGLTDEEVFAALVAVDGNTKRLAPGFVAFYCAIEAALKAKNG